jgi:hypothetical protein
MAAPTLAPTDLAADLQRRLDAAAAEGLEANIQRFLRFRGTDPEEWIEFQTLEPSASNCVQAKDAVRELQEGDKRRANGQYLVINKLRPGVEARRQPNYWHPLHKGESTTCDTDILSRTLLYVDIDAERVKGISATNEEIVPAHNTAAALYGELCEEFGSDSVAIGSSGNGRAVFVALDHPPADEETKQVIAGISACIRYLHEKSGVVKFDHQVFDAKRIVPAFGTMKRKGTTHFKERPHRRTSIVTPTSPVRVSVDALRRYLDRLLPKITEPKQINEIGRLIGRKPAPTVFVPAGHPAAPAADDAFRAANAVPVARVADWLGLSNGEYPICPGCGLTGDSSVAYVGNGIKCSHARCAFLGVAGRPGFRSVVDIVMENRHCTPREALVELAAEFGEQYGFSAARPQHRPPPPTPHRAPPAKVIQLHPKPLDPEVDPEVDPADDTSEPCETGPEFDDFDDLDEGGQPAPTPPPTHSPSTPTPPDLAPLIQKIRSAPKDQRISLALSQEAIRAVAALSDVSPDFAMVRAEIKSAGVPIAIWDKAVRLARPIPPSGSARRPKQYHDGGDGDPPAIHTSRASYAQAVAALRANYDDKLTYNELGLTPMLSGDPLSDSDIGRIREELEVKHGLESSKENTVDAIRQISDDHRYHPVRQYIESLAWDGCLRIDRICREIIGAAATPLNLRLIRAWFVSAVVRIMEPGCKVDTALVLVGEQSYYKSSFFRILAGPWFSDTKMDISNKDGLLQLHSAWIHEWGEIEQVTRRKDNSEVKNFITRADDLFREPYARGTSKHARFSVIVGTTNDQEFLTDPTGSRRYWVIPVPQPINRDLLIQWRDQLWAEAHQAYIGGYQWWLTREEDAEREHTADQHQVEDAFQIAISKWLRTMDASRILRDNTQTSYPSGWLTSADILQSALGLDKSRWSHGEQTRIGVCMRRLRWHKSRVTLNGERMWVYSPPGPVCDNDTRNVQQ